MPVHKGPTKGLPPEMEQMVTRFTDPFSAPWPMAAAKVERVRMVT